MNKEQIIDEVYGNFIKSYTGKDNEIILPPLDYINDDGNLMSKNQFITNIKYDYWFSEKWGLKIEERKLSLDERNEWFQIHLNGNNPFAKSDWKDFELDQQNIPTKLITITYNGETIESYE